MKRWQLAEAQSLLIMPEDTVLYYHLFFPAYHLSDGKIHYSHATRQILLRKHAEFLHLIRLQTLLWSAQLPLFSSSLSLYTLLSIFHVDNVERERAA